MTTARLFEQRPRVRAVQWDGERTEETDAVIGRWNVGWVEGDGLRFETEFGSDTAWPGDWLIYDGCKLTRMKADRFSLTYSEVSGV